MRFSSNGEIAAMELITQQGGGFFATQVFANPENVFDFIVGVDEALDGDLTFDHEVLRTLTLGEEFPPI